ncbi:MAG TPA: class II aldolase/adducin family protein, partial [Candidatus Polarisedimenticolaceae bacterium]|nr:class II aldolase/adducin family protein [Candidatus Polarisedimenticolaceae bacterium]
ILRNHGLITVGETVADAFVAMYFLESSCQIQVRAQSGGGELIPVPKEVLDAAYAGPAQPRRRGETIWPGLLRRLDRIDPSYQD